MMSLKEIAYESLEQTKFRFSPPLYVQRYLYTAKIIRDYGNGFFSKVVDIGCAEFGLFHHLKKLRGIREIIFMDTNFQLLKDFCYKVNPLASDALHKRQNPLSISVLCGDAKFAHSPTKNADVVTMLEFIEHVHEEELKPIVKNVFEFISPKLVIITTPNRDFNKYFLNFKKGKFRHLDHKFEWSNEEFENWCKNVVDNYPEYEVSFTGCGGPREGIYCTQIGIFNKFKIKKTSGRNKTIETAIHLKKEHCRPLAEPCQGCRSSVCNIVQVTHYPLDSRTREQKYKDFVLSFFGKLRFWLKECLQSLDYNGDNIFYIYNEAQSNSNVTSKDKCLNSDLNELHSSLSQLELNTADRGTDSSEDTSNISAPCSASIEGTKFIIKFIDTYDSWISNCRTLLDDEFFYYLEIEETFYFTLNTFVRWTNQSLDDIMVVKNYLIQSNIKIIEVDSYSLICLSFGRRESDDE